ncbi:MAG: glycosyltransferase [Deltaproteobacteria bacterium]|nr:glycosyltransferase [Deltaproteobacteria bacterium]
MKEPFRISVVVPTLDGADTLPALIHALDAQQGVEITERIAIDSGSIDRTRDILERGRFRIIQRPRALFNHGLTRNDLVELSTSPLVAFFSQDAVPAGPETLAELARPFDLSPRVMGSYARQIPAPGASRLDQLRIRRSRAGRREARRASGADLDRTPAGALLDLCDFHNAASMVRRDGFMPFPETELAEDLQWAHQVLKHGGQIAFVPTARVYHSVERPLREEWERLKSEARVLAREFGYRPAGIGGQPAARTLMRGLMWGAADAAAVLTVPGRAPVRSLGRALALGPMRALSFWKESR